MLKKIRIFILILTAAFFYLSFPENLRADNNYNWFWFIYENESSYQDFYTIRPFYHSSETEKFKYSASLPPILYWEYKTDKMRYRQFLLGLVNDVDYIHSDKSDDYDFAAVFPLFLFGHSNENNEDNYLMIWPFGGVIKGKLAQDVISPWIFPGVALFFISPPATLSAFALYTFLSWIPVYTYYEKNDFKGHALFWPLIQWGSSEKRSTFRILPFYAHYKKDDYYDNRSYFMVFNFRDTIYPGRHDYSFFFFPFYGRKWSTAGYSHASTLLWPFFTWGYDIKNGYYNINFPWPFFQYARADSDGLEKLIFFPFYGRYDSPSIHTKFITPFYFNIENIDKYFYSDYTYYGLIFWKFYRKYEEEHVYYGKEWNYTKLWPLFSYEKNDRGDFSFSFLSLLPFRDAENYERMYNPLWSIFEYSSFGGNRKLGVLMRTYFQYWNNDVFYSKIPLIYTYKSQEKNLTQLTFIANAFGYVFNEKGEFCRIFWIPVKISDKKNKDVDEISLLYYHERNPYLNPDTEIELKIHLSANERESIFYSYEF
ncbi:MAG: hypothetical protein JW982_13060 [Spirochaetes bacterium]|nr:hypothetical protein [Spirochaetota bacterium]